MTKGKLTVQQQRFVQGVIAGKSQTEAYCEAYRVAGKVSASNANRVMHYPWVQAYYEALKEKVLGESEALAVLSGQKILEELAKIAFANATDYAQLVQQDGEMKLALVETSALSEEQQVAIAGYEKSAAGVIKIKLHNKVRALELLGKHFGLFNPVPEKPKKEPFKVELTVLGEDENISEVYPKDTDTMPFLQREAEGVEGAEEEVWEDAKYVSEAQVRVPWIESAVWHEQCERAQQRRAQQGVEERQEGVPSEPSG